MPAARDTDMAVACRMVRGRVFLNGMERQHVDKVNTQSDKRNKYTLKAQPP
jgi:hypothetical protein